MLFYDFEVFKFDWLVVIQDPINKKEYVIINDRDELEALYEEKRKDIWVGFNSRHYDQYILKGILCGFDPKVINDYIIVENIPGWKFSKLFNNVPLNNYDVMLTNDKGLKSFEGFMGSSIEESSIPFSIDRRLTTAEIAETIKYCRHDVEQTMKIFIKRKSEFEAHLSLVKLIRQGKSKNLDLSLLNKTKAQLSAIMLNAVKKKHDDEFNIDFPDTLILNKYTEVLEWYKNHDNMKYVRHVPGKKRPEAVRLKTIVASVPHTFGWGGLHGAIPKYHGTGKFINMDVASLYPSLMIRYNLHSRNMENPSKYKEIYEQRLQYKKEKNPLQAPLKLVLNGTYGAMKDKNNNLYDPLQANRVCVYGQLLILDLVEKLEPHAEIIQSNTDGVLIRMPDYWEYDDWYDLIDDTAAEWEKRTGLKLEFDEYREVFQKDVNNYLIVDEDGKYKSVGDYLKKLNDLDYNLPVINRALVSYMLYGVPIETTINHCNDLREFQLVSKITSKYSGILRDGRLEPIKEKCVRIFASLDPADGGIYKLSVRTGSPEKIANSPEHCFIVNDDITGVTISNFSLDKQWYIDLANKRLAAFGVV